MAERFVGYIRVSQVAGRDREGESFRSPEQQRALIEQWADTRGAAVIGWYEDLGVSGSRMSRPGLNAALEAVREGRANGVAVAFLDRFTRASVGEAMTVLEEVKASGASFVAADMAGLRPDDPTGEFALTVLIAAKRMEWRTSAERWDQSRADAIREGKGTSRPPFGYRYTDPTPRASGSGVIDSTFVVFEPERPIVVELFERKAGGATWLELARWLDTVAPKPGGRRWARNTVRGMIERRTYLGERGSGEHVNPTAHDAIVSAALWRRAQPAPGHRTPRGAYLLSGLVRCAGCGRRMRATSGGRGSKPATYTCVTAECAERYTTVTVQGLDAEVVGQLFAHLDAFHVQAVDDDEIAAAQAEVDARGGDVERLAAVVPSSTRGIAVHQAALEGAERALAEAEDHRDQLLARRAQAGPDVHELRDDWPSLAMDERREIARAGIEAVIVRRSASRAKRPPVAERIRVVFRGEAPAGLLDNGRSGAVRAWSWDDDPASLAPAA